MSMDIASQKIVDLILAKEITTISGEDRDYLCSRRSYLTERDIEKYGLDLLVALREDGIEVPGTVVTREGYVDLREKHVEEVKKAEAEAKAKAKEEAKAKAEAEKAKAGK